MILIRHADAFAPKRFGIGSAKTRQSLVSIAIVSQCAGINRHMVGHERAPLE